MLPIPPNPPVAVLGGGITGLTAAWYLRQAGLTPVVFEAAPRTGGAINGIRTDGWLHELGPNSLLEGAPEVSDLVESVGLGDRRIYASPAAKHRYIVRRGKPVRMPMSPLSFLTTSLFSARAKLALLGEPWRPRPETNAEESVADFVVRRLGREFLDYAINPLVGGVYAGDPQQLSVRQAFPKLYQLEQDHGSLIRGALKKRNTSGGPKGRIFSFPSGLNELPAALAAGLGDAVRLRHAVSAVRRREHHWRVEFEVDGVPHTEAFSAVVSALPADALAELELDTGGEIHRLESLLEIKQPPVASVFLGFKREDVAHPLDGFGMLIPQVEHRAILGTLFSSSLFPGRAPDGFVGLTSFVGGMRDPDLVDFENVELLRLVRAELEQLVGARGAPVFSHVKRWRHAIPQYTLGYQRFKDAITAVERTAPGLYIGGNCRDGISLANCIASGRRLATAAIEHMQAENAAVER